MEAKRKHIIYKEEFRRQAGTRDNFACRKPFFLNAGSDSSNTTHVEDHGRTMRRYSR
jgi:hypothetical protein